MSSPVNILVVGATGKQGGKAISTLLGQSNLSLRFLTRNPSSESAKKLVEKGVTAVQGDLNDIEALDKALAGVDRAFLVTDAMAGEEKEAEQGINFVNAAKKAGVEHIVFSSVCAADTAKNVPHFRSKAKVESSLKASGLSYTILRPAAFMDNFPVNSGFARFMLVGAFYAALGWGKCQLIAVEDIGVFAGKALLNTKDDTYRNKTIDLAAGNYAFEDIRHAILKSQGYTPWLASLLPTFIRNLLPHDFREMMYFFATEGYPPVDANKLRSIHPQLLSLEDYFRENKV
ncbi:uncharacterized protein IL334_007444 [Kwoniella shivajii]|uniref:NmrA-like domain-containing protein n=1 Tax=Kwoniella shivajii TaxID=564305 RepID=A0ABZ1DBU2_9TREE|nr:hypothetical protein IL334_007444 [Kwoniella shivajii]